MALRGEGRALGAFLSWDDPDVDTRVPTINAVTREMLRTSQRDVEAYTAGTKEDERKLCGPRIPQNLRGEAAKACVELHFAKLLAVAAT